MDVQDFEADTLPLPVWLAGQVLQAIAQFRFGVGMADPHGTVTYVNGAFTTLTGFSSEEIVGQHVEMLMSPDHDSRFYDTIRQTLSAGQSWSDKLTIRKKDGSQYHSRSVIEPVTDQHGTLIAYSFFSRDMADEARLEAQLGQLQKMEAIGEMAAGIAHEINTPIQYVGDNIQFLKSAIDDLLRLVDEMELACEEGRTAPVPGSRLDGIAALREEIDLDYLKEELPQAIEQSLEGRDRVAAIVRAMKEFAHPGDEERAEIDVNHAIENTLAVSRGEWKFIADIKRDLDPQLPPVPCFPGLFNQVLLNLVVNAAHAIGDVHTSGQEEKGCITVATRREGGEVVVMVGDTGCGIPAEQIQRIFEPFFTTKDVGKGTGQGLALTHAVIVEKMGGRIDVDSTPGKGTQFLLFLPLDDTGASEDIGSE